MFGELDHDAPECRDVIAAAQPRGPSDNALTPVLGLGKPGEHGATVAIDKDVVGAEASVHHAPLVQVGHGRGRRGERPDQGGKGTTLGGGG